MEERKSRRRSLRTLRRSSSSWIVPTQAILQGIESNGENLLAINSAYGSAWLGENTMQDIITYAQPRSSPENVTKAFFPNLDTCPADEVTLPAKVMKNSDSDSSPFIISSSKPLTETQSCNRMECETLRNMFVFNSKRSPKMVQQSVGTKSPATLNKHYSLHNRNNNEASTTSFNSSLNVSFNKQNSNTVAQRIKSQKKVDPKCDTLRFKSLQTKSNSSTGNKPNFLKTTQSFSLKHSSVNRLSSPKKSSARVQSLKTPTLTKVQLPSKAGHSNSSFSEPQCASKSKNIQDIISNLSSHKSDCKDLNGFLNEENHKPKSRKRLSLRKSLTETVPLAAESEKTNVVVQNATGVELNCGDVSAQSSASTGSSNSCGMDRLLYGYDNLADSKEDEQNTLNNCIYDIEMTEEFLKSFDLPFFPSNAVGGGADDVFKKERDKRKSLRRSSRYFSAHEMPLARPSLEEDTEPEASPKTSLDEQSPVVLYEEANVISKAQTSLILSDSSNEKMSLPVSSAECHPTIITLQIPSCNYSVNKPEGDRFINQLNGQEHMFFSEPNTKLMEEMMNGFNNMSVDENIKSYESLAACEMMAGQSEPLTLDVNGNRNLLSDTITDSQVSPTDKQVEHQMANGQIVKAIPQASWGDNVEMIEYTSDKNACQSIESEVEMQETAIAYGNGESEHLDSDFRIGKRALRARKSWDFSQSSQSLEAKTARKRNSEGLLSSRKGSKKELAEDCPSPLRQKGGKEISPGLRDLYLNKLYAPPKAKTWETIKESPKDDSSIFTKQKSKRFLQFEAGVTTAKLQRRHKKAAEIKRKIVTQNVTLSDEEFRRRLLDVQLFLDDLP